MMNYLAEYKDQAVELAKAYAPKVSLALFTLVIGSWLTGGMKKLAPFVLNLLSWLLKAVLFISVASMVGVETTSFVAILGAAGLAVGLALQGSLSNFAGGVLVLIFRPYEVGDVIEAQGHLGTVEEIQIFTTVLLTPQNRRVIIPNGVLSNGSIVNYTAEGTARVDIAISIEYRADIAKARSSLLDLLKKDERVLDPRAAAVVVTELADSSVNLAVRPYCRWRTIGDSTVTPSNSAKPCSRSRVSEFRFHSEMFTFFNTGQRSCDQRSSAMIQEQA